MNFVFWCHEQVITARNLESPKDDGSHEDKSCGKIGLRVENEFGTW